MGFFAVHHNIINYSGVELKQNNTLTAVLKNTWFISAVFFSMLVSIIIPIRLRPLSLP